MTTGTASVTVDGYTFTVTVTKTPVTTTGVQAARVADFLSLAGPTNLFPVLDPNVDPWGSYPADYRPATVIAAINWLTNGSGIMPVCRVYCYTDREALLAAWLPQLAAIGVRFTIAIGSGGGIADVPAILRLASNPANGIIQIEGVNEPNGQSQVAVADVIIAQQALWAGKPTGVKVTGPSIVTGLPFPEGWITPSYASASQMAALLAAMDIATAHYYPSALCDLDDGSGRGGEFDDMVLGLTKAFPGKPLVIGEHQPTLFAKAGLNTTLDAYYLPIWLLSAFRLGVRQAQYFPLFDFGTDYPCGLFPLNATNPRPAAWVIRALHTLMADHGATRFTFAPGKLNYTVSGLPAPINAALPHTGGQHALFQASDGRFFLFLWNSQVAPGGPRIPVTITFDRAMPGKEYNVSLGTAASMTAIQSVNASGVVSQLDGSVRLLVIG